MRQTAVECLRHRGDLREKCALLDAKAHQELDQNHLIAFFQRVSDAIYNRVESATGSSFGNVRGCGDGFDQLSFIHV